VSRRADQSDRDAKGEAHTLVLSLDQAENSVGIVLVTGTGNLIVGLRLGIEREPLISHLRRRFPYYRAATAAWGRHSLVSVPCRLVTGVYEAFTRRGSSSGKKFLSGLGQLRAGKPETMAEDSPDVGQAVHTRHSRQARRPPVGEA
jgi:hypothetical protein